MIIVSIFTFLSGEYLGYTQGYSDGLNQGYQSGVTNEFHFMGGDPSQSFIGISGGLVVMDFYTCTVDSSGNTAHCEKECGISGCDEEYNRTWITLSTTTNQTPTYSTVIKEVVPGICMTNQCGEGDGCQVTCPYQLTK